MKSLLGDSETDRDKPVFGGSCCRLRLLLPGWHVLTIMKFRSDSLPRRAAVPPKPQPHPHPRTDQHLANYFERGREERKVCMGGGGGEEED